MKRSIKTLFLLAFVIMLTTSYAVRPVRSNQPNCYIVYYWFDPTRTWMGRKNTICDEIFLTDYNESTQNPKTLQEMGWTVGNVTFDQWGTPIPLSSYPNKILYSHP